MGRFGKLRVALCSIDLCVSRDSGDRNGYHAAVRTNVHTHVYVSILVNSSPACFSKLVRFHFTLGNNKYIIIDHSTGTHAFVDLSGDFLDYFYYSVVLG